MTHLPKPSQQSPAKPCVIRVVRVSGTIRKSEEEAIRRARATILRAKGEVLDNTTERLEAILGPPDAARKASAPIQTAQATPSIEDDDDEEMESGSDDD